MKKYLFLLPILALGSISLNACNKSVKTRVTYGTYIDSTAIELKYTDLVTKIANGENLLISVYADGLPCGCWDTFKGVLNKYVETYHTRMYYIARSQFSSDDDTFGLKILREGTNPTFAFIKNGKKSSEFVYGESNRPMFESLEGLRSAVKRIAGDPVYMFVDQDKLDKALFEENSERVVVQYVWSFCPDCNDCFPNVMTPYGDSHEFKNEVWIIDLAIPGLLINDEGKVDKENPGYVSFLKEHHMSAEGDEKYGYDRGFVPTTQIWESGTLKDMNVYFNDKIELIGSKYKVTQTYFTEDRIKSLKYTKTVLLGTEVSEENVEKTVNPDGTISYSWKKDDARKYHKPILEDFLDRYVKK